MIDAVTLAVVRGALDQIADEMDLHLIRAAVSPIISETNDCAHGIFHPATGETIAQGHFGLPLFLANMQFTVQAIIAFAQQDGGFHPADVWIVNDPYISGTHLNDVVLVSPYFVDGQLVALLGNTGHWMDMGGSVAGGWVPKATDIHQEGIIIPPMRLYDAGKYNEALVQLIKANVRLPDQLAGDLAAMVNVFRIGRRGLDSLVEKYGLQQLQGSIDELMRRSEIQMRSYISEIPNGTYQAVDHFDNDGVIDVPLNVALSVTVADDELHLDFSGTSPAARGPMNVASCTAKSMCFVALKHLFPDVPVNGGTFRPVKFTIPAGCLLSARYPSPVGGSSDVNQRVVDVVFGALTKAMPDVTPAAPFGTAGVITMSGKQTSGGRVFVAVFPYPGGYGASSGSDGLVNGTPPGSMAKFMSIEVSEHRYPLRFEYFRIREGSGGAGRFRGGCGTAYGIRPLSNCSVSVFGDRVDYAPFGAQGGLSAAPNHIYMTIGGKDWIPPMRSKAESIPLQLGDCVHAASPGGGGFGLSWQRDVGAVEQDLNGGLIDIDTANQVYGVVATVKGAIAGRVRYSIDAFATETKRRGKRNSLLCGAK
jgi:N-methylhydantoinase B